MTRADRTSPLVAAAWLQEHLEDPDLRIVEISTNPEQPLYREGHIPGAIGWYWKDALWHPTDREFPTPAEMAERLGRAGVSPATTVVLYGDAVQFSTYAFWVLTMCGHRKTRVLDGGRQHWIREGRPLTTAAPAVRTVAYPAAAGNQGIRVGRDDVRARLGHPDRLLLDARSPGEYRGEVLGASPEWNHGAERLGRIPGAVNLYFEELLNADQTFKPIPELRARLERAGVDLSSPREIVAYCRLSHRASLVWFVLTQLLGRPRVRVYDGSWTEWGSMVGMPVER